MKKVWYILGVIVIATLAMCKKPFNPQVIDTNTNLLVVDGTIVSGADSTFIKLSRTVKLTAGSTQNPETNATLIVEDDQNGVYNLKETLTGLYISAGLKLNTARNYRLRIKTKNGEEYLSDYTPVKVTPPIDSIGFNVVANGLNIYANAHDASNNTRYYRWEYEDAWRFNSYFESFFITNGTAIVPRQSNQNIHECYAGGKSSSVVIATTSKLSQDVLFQAPVELIDPGSEKISIRYTILLKQYAITKEAYEFWLNIKKNTENLGSIFDAQPSAATGNIHCISDAGRPVIGYVSVSTIQQKRVFIDRSQLPAEWKTVYPDRCIADSTYIVNPKTGQREVQDRLIPIGSTSIPLDKFVGGYFATTRFCADCTVRGTLKAPPFWK